MTHDSRSTNPGDQPTPEAYEAASTPSVTYQSYLLRLWHEGGANTPWRAMLENVTEPGIRHHFADLERMLAFLQIACAHPVDNQPDRPNLNQQKEFLP